jgi:hypothetical protein
MFQTKNRVAAAVLIVSSLSLGVPSLVLSQDVGNNDDHPSWKYSEASFKGHYAVVGTYGANVAQALGTLTVNDGKIVTKEIVNEPLAGSKTGERTLVKISSTGTFTIASDGTGVVTDGVKLADGSIATVTEDLVITKAEVIDGELVATELVSAQREASVVVPGGVFLTRHYTRRPN